MYELFMYCIWFLEYIIPLNRGVTGAPGRKGELGSPGRMTRPDIGEWSLYTGDRGLPGQK